MRHRTRFLGLLVGALAATTVGLDALPAAAGDITACPPGVDCDQFPVMDAQIAKKEAGPYVGVGAYSESGAGQTVKKNIKANKTRVFHLRIHNVEDTGEVELHGTQSPSPCYAVNFWSGALDITNGLFTGLSGTLPGGAVRDYWLEVKAGACAVPGAKVITHFEASPTIDGLDHDRVRAKVKVKA